MINQPLMQVWTATLQVMVKLMARNVDKPYLGVGVDVDGFSVLGDIDSVEGVKSCVCWGDGDDFGSKGSLNCFPDSRKSVRQGILFISILPVGIPMNERN